MTTMHCTIRHLCCGLLILATIPAVGCKPLQINNLSDRLRPSNARHWSPEHSILPYAVVQDDTIELHNIRNINYLSDEDFVVKHYDRTIQLSDVQSIDFVATPFNSAPLLAHTMLSFGLSDGSHIGLSVEIRNENGEKYSPLLGIGNQFEVTYVIADEKDLIRVRTNHRDSDVYVYPSVATPQQAQELFVDVLTRVNELNAKPEFYNTFYNNCTTNLVGHVNQLKTGRVPFNFKVLLPGFSAKYAYDIGLLDNRIPFEDLKNLAHVNDLVEQHYNDDDFSQKIRSGRYRIERLVNRQNARQPTIDSTGGQFLEDNQLSLIHI